MKVKGETLTRDSRVSIRYEFIRGYNRPTVGNAPSFAIRRIKVTRKYKHALDVLYSCQKRQRQALVYFKEKIIGAVYRDIDTEAWVINLCQIGSKQTKVCAILR
jgi:hypothetical protein